MSDEIKTRERERQAFAAGAIWHGGYAPNAQREAESRYPHPEIQLAPSGRFYRLVEQPHGYELKAWESHAQAVAGHCPYYAGAVKRGDERAVAALLLRLAEGP